MNTYQDIKDIEIEGEFIGDVMYKPTWPIYIMMVFAFLLLLVNSIAARMLAVFIGVVVAFVFFKVEDKKTLSIYSKCILIYDFEGVKAVKIDNREIVKYDGGFSEQYKVFIELANGMKLYKETFRMSDAIKYMKIALPNKTTQEVNREKNKNTKIDLISGFKRLIGIKNNKKEDK